MNPTTSPSDLDQTLQDRGNVHGDFHDNAYATFECLKVLSACPAFKFLTPVQSVAIFHIVHKLARACSGDSNHLDHWHDIQGYAKLVETSIIETHGHKPLTQPTT